MVVKAGLMEDERTMSGLLPVARMARPRRGRRNRPSITAIASTAMTITNSLYWLPRIPPLSISLALVNTVSVLFMFSIEEPPITPIFTEYSAVLTIMPESRLFTPILVCKMAVIKPDATPESIAAGMER